MRAMEQLNPTDPVNEDHTKELRIPRVSVRAHLRLELKQAPPKKLWLIRKRSRNGERPEAQTGGSGEIPGLLGETGADRAENAQNWDQEPGSLSAEDDPGQLCSEVGSAGADGACVPASPE